eukprot:GHVQ01035139.1.p1 GENE.GHVQ01035139.1~~GHVQ01035139.1.p1  ORF type:complete len:372 (-),score=89.44 GHVQ01035139.1:1257-2261(-)
MPRAEVGTNKWLANKMKAKGLQKLRWYCQMCEKQCRDENGFKCHRMSEGHQRQMQVFSQNSERFMDDFSRSFEHDFMQLMRTRYCRTRVKANTVYCEVIADKQHVHMNATIWVTLSSFVQYLAKSQQCKIDYTPKGWFLEYIDKEKIHREEESLAKRKAEETAEEKSAKRIGLLVDEAKSKGGYQKREYTDITRKVIVKQKDGGDGGEDINSNRNVCYGGDGGEGGGGEERRKESPDKTELYGVKEEEGEMSKSSESVNAGRSCCMSVSTTASTSSTSSSSGSMIGNSSSIDEAAHMIESGLVSARSLHDIVMGAVSAASSSHDDDQDDHEEGE